MTQLALKLPQNKRKSQIVDSLIVDIVRTDATYNKDKRPSKRGRAKQHQIKISLTLTVVMMFGIVSFN